MLQGQYRWCHDKVVAVLADTLEQEKRKKQPAKTRLWLSTITSVKQGQTPVVHTQARQNFLQAAQRWKIEVDFRRRQYCPPP